MVAVYKEVSPRKVCERTSEGNAQKRAKKSHSSDLQKKNGTKRTTLKINFINFLFILAVVTISTTPIFPIFFINSLIAWFLLLTSVIKWENIDEGMADGTSENYDITKDKYEYNMNKEDQGIQDNQNISSMKLYQWNYHIINRTSHHQVFRKKLGEPL